MPKTQTLIAADTKINFKVQIYQGKIFFCPNLSRTYMSYSQAEVSICACGGSNTITIIDLFSKLSRHPCGSHNFSLVHFLP